jgi:hypothetical protein
MDRVTVLARSQERELERILRSDRWLMDVLEAARLVAAPQWVIGAGVIRDIVWDRAHGIQGPHKDVDLAFFDPFDLSRDRDLAVEAQLMAVRPDVDWDAKNQAAVHRWYEGHFGHPIPPIVSIEDAASRWPETATAVAVRLEASGELTIVAPLGLEDLLGPRLRHNRRQVTREYFEERRIRKNISQRWPRVEVISD